MFTYTLNEMHHYKKDLTQSQLSHQQLRCAQEDKLVKFCSIMRYKCKILQETQSFFLIYLQEQKNYQHTRLFYNSKRRNRIAHKSSQTLNHHGTVFLYHLTFCTSEYYAQDNHYQGISQHSKCKLHIITFKKKPQSLLFVQGKL